MGKLYQQIDFRRFHIGTSANEDWFINNMGALDVEAPEYDNTIEKAKWDYENSTWIVKNIEEWSALE